MNGAFSFQGSPRRLLAAKLASPVGYLISACRSLNSGVPDFSEPFEHHHFAVDHERARLPEPLQRESRLPAAREATASATMNTSIALNDQIERGLSDAHMRLDSATTACPRPRWRRSSR